MGPSPTWQSNLTHVKQTIIIYKHKTPKYYNNYVSVFLISLYGAKSFLFGAAQFSLWASGAVNYDYIVSNSINS